jgi:hypothetical protein
MMCRRTSPRGLAGHVGMSVKHPWAGITARRTTLSALLPLAISSSLALAPALAQPAPMAAPPIHVDVSQAPAPAPGHATDDDATEIAKKLQNPVGDLISVPFANYANFNVGPNKGTQDILQLQPVVPIHVNEDWNVITRTVLPFVWSPSFQPAASVPSFGVAPTTFTAFLSPRNPVDGWVWGVGPSVVVVKLAGPIVAGVLVNNIFSLGGTMGPRGTRYSTFLLEPFFNYNLSGGWFVGTVPIITANWDTGGAKWTLPIGVQAGRVIKVGGKLPIKLEVGAYYNALRPTGGGTWQLLTEAALVF